MYPRKRALKTISSLLHNKVIIDDEGKSNGRIIEVVNKIVDIAGRNIVERPLLSIMPAPHNVVTGLLGHYMDSDYRISIQGFVARQEKEELIDAGEDVVEFITHFLTDQDNVETMRQARFSIVSMGPILNEQYDDEANIAYISVPLVIQFVEN